MGRLKELLERCCRWLPCIGDVDADDLFAYKASRRVIIRDRKLGIVRILIMLAMVGYVLIWTLILEKGYLRTEEPHGFARLSVRRMGWGSAPTGPYCCGSADCIESGYGSPRGKLECVEWDQYGAVHPASEEWSSFITTRVSINEAETTAATGVSCAENRTSALCPPWALTRDVPYYVAGVEDMTVMLSHGVYGIKNDLATNFRDMEGAELLSAGGAGGDSGKVLQDFGGDPDRPGDIISIGELLNAAGGVTLDEINLNSDTKRYDGVVLLIVIVYSGTGMDSSLSYQYHVKHVPGAEFKYEQVSYSSEQAGAQTSWKRTIWNRHGVRLVVIDAGQVGAFSFTEMLKTVAGGLALLKVARLLVEQILLRVLPEKKAYKRYRDLKTADFSEPHRIAALTERDFVYGEPHDSATISFRPTSAAAAAAAANRREMNRDGCELSEPLHRQVVTE